MRKQLKKALSMALSAAMVVTLGSGISFNKASAEEAKTYTGLLAAANTKADGGWVWTSEGEAGSPVAIQYDGEYTIKLTTDQETTSDLMYMSIPDLWTDASDKIKFSDWKLKLDGEEVALKTPTPVEDTDKKGALRVNLSNPWNADDTYYDTSLKWSKTAELSFTVTGLAVNPNPIVPTEVPSGSATDVPTASASTVPTGSATETPTEAPPLVQNKIFEDEVSWTYGGDKDCRLQIANLWGLPLGEMDEKLKDKAFSKIEITFTASGVEDALKAAGITEFTGALCYDMAGGQWDDAKADVTISKDGEYTVTAELSEETAIANYLALRFKALDGTVKQSEEEGGQTEGPLKFSNVKVTLYGSGNPLPTATPEPTKDPNEGDPTYKETWDEKGVHAFLFYQTTTWDYRNVYAPKTDDKADSYHYIQAAGADVTNTAKVVDAFLTKNGEYTVSISGIDLSAADKFNMLGISTDISKELYPDVKITEEKVSIDGKVVTSDTDMTPIGKEDDKTNNFLVINEWDPDRDTEGGPVHYPLGKANADEELDLPEDSIEITFKVEGLDKVLQDIKTGNYVDPETGNKIQNDKVEVPAQPSASPSTQPSASPSTQPTKAPEQAVGVAQGKSFTSGNFSYKVTKAATTSKKGTVTVSLSKKGKKAAKLTVGATVKKSGATYTINAVAKNGFKGAKAKQITLGKSIKKIPSGAFANCKKLSKLTLKAKLSSVAKKSFKGCKKKITVKGTAKKANVKKLKKSGYKKFK